MHVIALVVEAQALVLIGMDGVPRKGGSHPHGIVPHLPEADLPSQRGEVQQAQALRVHPGRKAPRIVQCVLREEGGGIHSLVRVVIRTYIQVGVAHVQLSVSFLRQGIFLRLVQVFFLVFGLQY